MGRIISEDRRRKLQPQAYALSVRGMMTPAIAKQLHISEGTVDNYLKAERKRAWESMSLDDQQAATVDLLSEQNAAMEISWDMAEEARAANRWGSAAQHMSNFISASANKAKARGLFEAMNPALNLNVILVQLQELWHRPLPDDPDVLHGA